MRRRHACAFIVLALLIAPACVVLPDAVPDADVNRVSLEQGWRNDERALFAHQSQGTVMVPYEWFVALEQPEVKLVGTVGLFRDPAYLSRYGLLPDMVPVGASRAALVASHCEPRTDPALTPSDPGYHCGLPVGLARAMVTMPDTGERRDVVGFSCAGCHTGEIRYRGTAIRIEGASNSVDVTQFQAALGGALLLTQRLPFRFTRFADRVLSARGVDADSPEYGTARRQLREQLDAFMSDSMGEVLTAQRKHLYDPYPGGFGRTDALARIANMVFGTDMRNDANLAVGSAPVKFPSIWDAPYFSWAQYNASIEQSMVRNVGEALGVRARLIYARGGSTWGTTGEQESLPLSTVDVPGLFAVETLLRGSGDGYFTGLRSPVWPEEYFGRIAWDRARRGRQLYQERCQHCHLPPLADLVEVVDLPSGGKGLGPLGEPVYSVAGDPRSTVIGLESLAPGAGAQAPREMYWIANNHPDMLYGLVATPFARTEFFLNLPVVNLGTIRTDPGQASNFARAVIDTGDVLLPRLPPRYGGGPSEQPARMVSAGLGLQMVTIAITEQFFDRVDALTPAERLEFVRGLPPNLLLRDSTGQVRRDAAGNPMAAPALFLPDGRVNRDEWTGYRVPAATPNIGYRPHPLNGIWASPPYLHNGSVPTIYELLSPYEERPTMFHTGNREYDLNRLGYRTERIRGGFRFDTRAPGNSNYGHLFQDGAPGNGVIGPMLTPDDRRAIIEYIKTLCPPGQRTDYEGHVLCQPLPGLPGR